MQYLFIVETNSKCQSDKNYIYGIVKYYYEILGDKISFIFLGSKNNYDKVKDKITKKVNDYLPGKTEIFLCVDLDEINNENKILNDLIYDYCNNNSYNLIWFYEDIELALLKRKVNTKDKKKESEKFLNKKLYLSIDIVSLNKSKVSLEKNTSNLFFVLDQYLKRKL